MTFIGLLTHRYIEQTPGPPVEVAYAPAVLARVQGIRKLCATPPRAGNVQSFCQHRPPVYVAVCTK